MPWPKTYDAPALLERVSLNSHVAPPQILPVQPPALRAKA
jgi:hypothetical protein